MGPMLGRGVPSGLCRVLCRGWVCQVELCGSYFGEGCSKRFVSGLMSGMGVPSEFMWVVCRGVSSELMWVLCRGVPSGLMWVLCQGGVCHAVCVWSYVGEGCAKRFVLSVQLQTKLHAHVDVIGKLYMDKCDAKSNVTLLSRCVSLVSIGFMCMASCLVSLIISQMNRDTVVLFVLFSLIYLHAGTWQEPYWLISATPMYGCTIHTVHAVLWFGK